MGDGNDGCARSDGAGARLGGAVGGHVTGTESLDEKTIAAICGGNAKKLLGLK